MFERTRAEGTFFVALLTGSTVGGVAGMAASAISVSGFISDLSFGRVFGMAWFGVFFGFLPFLVIAVPACLALERRISSAVARTMILAAGGAGTGAAIATSTFDIMISWAAMVGGCTGIALGILRRHVPATSTSSR